MASSKDKKLVTGCSGGDCGQSIHATTTVEITQKVVNQNGDVNTVTETISAFDFYSCEEAIKRLNEYLDSELEPGERDDVVKHLQICAPCLERFQFEKSLVLAMRERICRSIAPIKLKERLKSLLKSGN